MEVTEGIPPDREPRESDGNTAAAYRTATAPRVCRRNIKSPNYPLVTRSYPIRVVSCSVAYRALIVIAVRYTII